MIDPLNVDPSLCFERKGKKRRSLAFLSELSVFIKAACFLFVFFGQHLLCLFSPTGPSVVVNLLLVVFFGQLTPVVLILFHNGT